MKIKYLDGKRLYYAFLAGGRAVMRDQQYLDKINVFPVPDSDTGTNLASTMRSIAQRARAFRSAHHTLGSIADAALTGARGNSGLIFAQFVYGLSQEARDEARLSPRRFAELVRRAAHHARQSILTPVEGTMITLLHDWAEAVYEQRLKMTDFAELLSYSLHIAEKSLRETPEKLEVLAKAGVVDAGAKGFFDFLEGVVNFIRKGDIKDIIRVETAPLPILAEAHASRSSVTKRYCSEALITGEGIDIDAVRGAVRAAGESAIVAGSRSKVRLHVHTDSPAGLFAKLREFGAIAEIKADDMLRQYEAAHRRQSPVALVTDSACDLPGEILDEHQIHMIPFTLSFGDSLYLDKVTITPDEFYTQLKMSRDVPKSAQPSPETVKRLLEFLAGHYERVLVVTISDKLTGLYRQALAVRESLGPDKILVVNSRQLSACQGLIVLRLAEAIRGGLSAEEIALLAESWIAKAKLWVDIRTLKYMVRGGRVSPLKGLLAGLLNIKPIISLDEEGRAVALGKSFSRRRNMTKIVGMIRREAAGQKVWNYAIVHAQNPYRALRYAKELGPVLGRKPAFIMDISPVIGVHNGIGVVGICLMFE
ncbi:MAG: DegV family protein [Candidatus Aminicenantales bacterium]|jgi:DegV family protein with EDD domain